MNAYLKKLLSKTRALAEKLYPEAEKAEETPENAFDPLDPENETPPPAAEQRIKAKAETKPAYPVCPCCGDDLQLLNSGVGATAHGVPVYYGDYGCAKCKQLCTLIQTVVAPLRLYAFWTDLGKVKEDTERLRKLSETIEHIEKMDVEKTLSKGMKD
jgi:hypothetical protein